MAKRITLILLTAVISALAIFAALEVAGENTLKAQSPPINAPHIHLGAKNEQTVDHDFFGYCGNTLTTIKINDKEYTFWGGDSVTLTDMLLYLDYSKVRVCKCPVEIKVNTEFGLGYEINLTESFARSEKGQVDLTEEQVKLIKGIIGRQCNN